MVKLYSVWSDVDFDWLLVGVTKAELIAFLNDFEPLPSEKLKVYQEIPVTRKTITTVKYTFGEEE